MNGVRGIESLATGDGKHHLSRTLGPALLMSMGYIDFGKWVAAVDAWAQFGYDLVLLMLLFNFSAVLYQYLSVYIGMVTGKNIAEICHKEYSPSICAIIGLQLGSSLVLAELTMLAGIAVGFNLVFEYDDIMTGLCFASVVVNLLPYTMSYLGKRMAGTFNACIAGFALLCFVLGLLVSHPKIPVDMNAMFPKLSGESSYSLMALLGANIISHNFYVHSSVVQTQRRSTTITLGALFHDHLFSILFILSGVFLVNYALIGSAAVESNDILVAFQDAVDLMNQMFMNPVAPIVLLVVLIFSSHIISLTSIIGSHAILKNIFGVNLPHSVHHLLLKGLRYRISSYIEILAFLAFLLMLFTNIIFAAEILFGDSIWTNNLKGNTGSFEIVPYAIVVLISGASIAFTLFLAVTPLKSASNEAESQAPSEHSKRDIDTTCYREELSLENVEQKEVQISSTINAIQRVPLENRQTLAFEHNDFTDITVESASGTQRPTVVPTIPQASASVKNEEPTSAHVVDWTEPMPEVCTATVVEPNTIQNIKMKSTTAEDIKVEAEASMGYDTEASHHVEFSKSTRNKVPPSNSDGPPSLTFSKGRDSDAGIGSGSHSKLPGLGRAVRRQFAAILDEFWGHLFDYHGKLTQEASTGGLNFLLGGTVSSAVVTDNQTIETSNSSLMRAGIRGSNKIMKAWDSLLNDKEVSSPDFNFSLQMGPIGSSNWSESMHLSNANTPSPASTLFQQDKQFYSNCNVPSYPDNQFYQPATIHGYQLSTSFKGMNANRSSHASIPQDLQRFLTSSESAVSNSLDSVVYACNQDVIGSLGAASLQSATMNRLNTMMVKRSYYDPSSADEIEGVSSSAYSKKYNSSPDISALIAASRSALPNDVNLGGAAGSRSYHHGRLACERSPYVNLATRSTTQLARGEYSQPNFHRDTSPTQLSMNPSTKSLWAQQPFEQLLGASKIQLNKGEANTERRSTGVIKDTFSYKEYEAKLLQSFQFCIMKLLKLEGSGWLFEQDGGCDENLVDQVAAAVRVSQDTTENPLSADLQLLTSDENLQLHNKDATCMHLLKCGDDCVWRAPLILSFGVWCIRQILNLSLVESRPELWGKYTYVLNRLQGIIDPAFSKPQKPVTGCVCLQKVANPISGAFTTAAMILEVIKNVEQAISGRKGRSGTAAGDVAFPKGKENLVSVLKRYKRRLSSKQSQSAGQ